MQVFCDVLVVRVCLVMIDHIDWMHVKKKKTQGLDTQRALLRLVLCPSNLHSKKHSVGQSFEHSS